MLKRKDNELGQWQAWDYSKKKYYPNLSLTTPCTQHVSNPSLDTEVEYWFGHLSHICSCDLFFLHRDINRDETET